MDWDKNGYITPIEFKSYLSSLKKGEEINSEEVYEAFDRIDTDGSKQIQWEEFLVRGKNTHHKWALVFKKNHTF